MNLGWLRLEPELCVPALTNALKDARMRVAMDAKRALCELGFEVGNTAIVSYFQVPEASENSTPASSPFVSTNSMPVRARFGFPSRQH